MKSKWKIGNIILGVDKLLLFAPFRAIQSTEVAG
jgi:hypothetical protein